MIPNNTVKRIRYFTARAEARANDPDVPLRQAAYLRALATLASVEIEYGNFLASAVRSPVLQCDLTGKPLRINGVLQVKPRPTGGIVMDWFYKSEEKGSDVNLAAHLLRDAFLGDCECAVIVSNDSDLLTPVRMAKQDCGIKIGLITPRQGGSAELRRLADFQKPIRAHSLVAAQFPATIVDAAGTITKPVGW